MILRCTPRPLARSLFASIVLTIAIQGLASAGPRDVTLLEAGSDAVRFRVEVAAPVLQAAADGFQELGVPGFDLDGSPGQAALPARMFLVAVPPSAVVMTEGSASDLEWSDAVRLPAIPWSPLPRTNARPEPSQAPLRAGAPEAVVRLVDVSWMRDQRVARVLVRPATYDQATRRLGIHRRVEVVVRFTNATETASPTVAPAARDGFDSVYRGALVNEEQGRAWRRSPSLARGGATPAGARVATVVPDTSLFAGRKWVKIAIPKTGFYKVYFGQLRNSKLFGGSDTTRLDNLRLFTWPGTPVLPEDSYCDSCGYREVAMGFVDVGTPPGFFDDNDRDYFYFFALGASDWTDLYAGPQDPAQPDTVFLNHPYETRNFYYLTIATAADPLPGPPLRILSESGDPVDTTGASTPATFPARLHFEEDRDFLPDATPILGFSSGTYQRLPEFWEKWFWTTINDAGSPLFTEPVPLPGLEPSLPARLRLRVWGLTAGSADGFSDHHLDVDFGDVSVDDFHQGWDGVRPMTIDTTATGLLESGSVLRARVPSPSEIDPSLQSPSRNDRIAVAWFDVFYRRRFVPLADSLTFDSDPAGGKVIYDIGPFSVGRDSLRIFDVTDPFAPIEILNPEMTPLASGGLRLRFERVEAGRRRYRIIPDHEGATRIVRPPNADVVDAAGWIANLRSGPGADYLVIDYDAFGPAAQELASWRREHLPLVGVAAPYDTMTVPISAVYDQFSGGRTDPAAIRNFLRAAYFNWTRKPTFVTLLGDASSDFKNIRGSVGGQTKALIPSWEGGFDTVWKRQFATDDWMLNVDDPLHVIPDFLGGRIPAADAGQALAFVRNKAIFYERSAPFGEWRDRVMLIADDNTIGNEEPDPLGWIHLQQTADLDSAVIPPEIDRRYVYLHTYQSVGTTKPGARADIIAGFQEGAVLTNYTGHGSPFKISDESVFIDNDADGLTNRERPTIFVAASCDVGKFNSPDIQGLGERLLFNLGGGAVGVVSATEIANSPESARLNKRIYQTLFERHAETGQFEATMAAGLLAAKLGSANNQKYQLMGDAALRPNLPRLWVETSVTDSAGTPVDTVARGRTMQVTGRLLDRPGGSPLAFDGRAGLLIADSAPMDMVTDCLACFRYRFRASPLFRGDVSVTGGRFATRFVVPLDAHLGPRGRARALVTVGGATLTDGVGVDSMVVAPGAAAAGDVSGPRVQLSFVGGSTRVRPDAVLRVDLFDESGILLTRNAPQNGIIVTIDESSTQRFDITPSFRYAANSYQSGAAFFTLPGLAPGTHVILVSAADNMAAGITAAEHRGTATITFEVSESPSLRVTRVLLFPNPVRSGGRGSGGQFIIDAPGDSVDVLLKIYTVSGRLIRVLRSTRGLAQAQIPWDGLDEEGSPLARGAYLFKAQVFTGLGGSGPSSQRAESLGRFVVVGPAP